MKKQLISGGALAVVAAASIFSISNVSATPQENGRSNRVEVKICHSRQPQPSQGQGQGAQDNPYGPKREVVDDDSITKQAGHDSHDGPVFNNTGQDYWGDIIPPFTYTEGGQEKQYTGLNWTVEGQAIWNNNCQYVAPNGSNDTDDDDDTNGGGQVNSDTITPAASGTLGTSTVGTLPETGTNTAFIAVVASIVAAGATGLSYAARAVLAKQ